MSAFLSVSFFLPRSAVPSKFRFSSISSTQQPDRYPEQVIVRHSSVAPPQYSQTLPPPPDLRISPNPVITTRGHPKALDSIDIAKVRRAPTRLICRRRAKLEIIRGKFMHFFLARLAMKNRAHVPTAKLSAVHGNARYIAADRRRGDGSSAARIPRSTEHRRSGTA